MTRYRSITIAVMLMTVAGTAASAQSTTNAEGGEEGGCFNCIIHNNGGWVWHQDVYWIYNEKWRYYYHPQDTMGYCSDFHDEYTSAAALPARFLDKRDAVLVALIRNEKAVILNASRGAIQLLDETRQHVLMHRQLDAAQIERLEASISGDESH